MPGGQALPVPLSISLGHIGKSVGTVFGLGFRALSKLVMFKMEEDRKLTLASAETLFSPAQKSIEELKGAMNLEQFRR